MAVQFQDDKFQHLESDIDKLRLKSRMYISHSNEAAATSLVMEILFNAIDECRNTRSPADSITIVFDERTGFIRITDNGRGMPFDVLETVLTTLNSGSNIDSTDKSELELEILGTNGTGTIAYTALAERVEVTSSREGKFKKLVFVEGKKVAEEDGKSDIHGMDVYFKPSMVLGKNTRIVWSDIHNTLINLQFLIKKKIKMKSTYIDSKGVETKEDYKFQEFHHIIKYKNSRESIISDKIPLEFKVTGIEEESAGKKYTNRFMIGEVVMLYTNLMTPYIESFSNANATKDNGHHLDGAIEGICRFFQAATKTSMSDREKEKLDIKWEDIKYGLSVVVKISTNMDQLYTNQSKHKVHNEDVEKIVRDQVVQQLTLWASANPSKLRDFINIIKTNARIRREGEKVRSAVLRDSLSRWEADKIKGYESCSNKGKAYKELYIVEGDSAKGSLKAARDPVFQALFAIRGVSANVFKMDLNGILKNTEFESIIKIMGCNVGAKFDLNRLQFDKIIIATDADVDGLFIRGLLLSFFFKVFPEIIQDERLFIAEPPLYRVSDKNNPFVINKEDYINRYISETIKNYRIGFGDGIKTPTFMDKKELKEFLSATSNYVDEIYILGQHYKVNERLIEMILHGLAAVGMRTGDLSIDNLLKKLDMQPLMNDISAEFKELYYDDRDNLIKGIVDGRYQSLEMSERLVRKAMDMIKTIVAYKGQTESLLLQDVKTNNISVHPLLATLKILKKYQPNIEHRFKGLGENKDEDLKVTIMNPNTRSLIKVMIGDIQNDLQIFSVLRGNSPMDQEARSKLIRSYKIDPSMIDT